MSVFGVLVLNLLFLLAGSCVLWGAGAWTTWGDWAWSSGVSYMSGLCAVSVLATLVPIYGGSLSAGAILALVAGVGVAGIVVGIARRRPFPTSSTTRTAPDLVTLALAGVTLLLLLLFFRVARIEPMTSWDAWGFWMTKAKAIYYFGGLDLSIFRQTWPSYPILVPALAAMNFRFMGAADTTALAVQWWLLGAGFVWASAGMLRRVAPARVTWLFLAIFVALPQFDQRLLERTADWPLDLFFGVAACALLVWVLTRETWLVVVFCLGLSAALLTKREGLLLAACLVAAGLLAADARRRSTWLAILGATAVAYLPAIPWRLWWTSRHLPGDTPPGGLVHATFTGLGQAPRAFELVAQLTFRYGFWLGTAPLALAAAIVCLRASNRRAAVFFLAAFGLTFIGWAWENWAFVSEGYPITSDPSLNPTNRTVASLVVLSTVAAPVLVGQLLAQRVRSEAPEAAPAAVSP